jgi:hypothetical protein
MGRMGTAYHHCSPVSKMTCEMDEDGAESPFYQHLQDPDALGDVMGKPAQIQGDTLGPHLLPHMKK